MRKTFLRIIAFLIVLSSVLCGCSRTSNNSNEKSKELLMTDHLEVYEDMFNTKTDTEVYGVIHKELIGKHIFSIGNVISRTNENGHDMPCLFDVTKYSPERVIGNIKLEMVIIPNSFKDDLQPHTEKDTIYIMGGI